jgi:hypothetical protein
MMYLNMPNITSLNGFAFFVQIDHLEMSTCKFAQKAIFGSKMGFVRHASMLTK